MNTEALIHRTLTRITTSKRLGPDAQVDDKALAIVPTAPELTDPFLALAEDRFSTPGFEWHPHRGLETVTLVVTASSSTETTSVTPALSNPVRPSG